jgi:DNA-binding CsgD family transcriptional regulator
MSQFLDDLRPKQPIPGATSLGEPHGHPKDGYMALLALSHTAVEHCLYVNMLGSLPEGNGAFGPFSIRRLMQLTGLSSYSSIRRACLGLIEKLSVETIAVEGESPQGVSVYRIFYPWEVFARRIAAGIAPYPKELASLEQSDVFRMIGENVMRRPDLSRREALVALLCAEGLSNAAIGKRLNINEKTVKYHLRHVFIKLGVKRRTELFGCLLKKRDWAQNSFVEGPVPSG